MANMGHPRLPLFGARSGASVASITPGRCELVYGPRIIPNIGAGAFGRTEHGVAAAGMHKGAGAESSGFLQFQEGGAVAEKLHLELAELGNNLAT
jgi:hypothetical protein